MTENRLSDNPKFLSPSTRSAGAPAAQPQRSASACAACAPSAGRACPEPFDMPFENLRVLSKVEGLTALSKIEGLVEGARRGGCGIERSRTFYEAVGSKTW